VILADTTVIVDFLRGKDAKLQGLITSLPIAICGAVRAEVLCGARDAAHRTKLLGQLARFHHLPFSRFTLGHRRR
jgi:predicted nucleic acid-binding protein